MTTAAERPEGVLPFPAPAGALEGRLEGGEVVFLPACPFSLPQGEDLDFLLAQKLAHSARSLSWDPVTGQVGGLPGKRPAEAERLRRVLAAFGASVAAWLASALPRYAGHCRPDRVQFHPEEEATRRVRFSARNDLLHIDAFPGRPTHGWRILRLFVNVNPTDPRIWVTSDGFAALVERYGREVGLPAAGEDSWAWQLGRKVLGLFQPGRLPSVYDRFMLRLHHFLKANEEFQERCHKRFLTFPPGSAWLAFTDSISHAALRGQFALDHSVFVAPEALVLPALSPPVLLQQACGVTVFRHAA
jgi:hypothetical protein